MELPDDAPVPFCGDLEGRLKTAPVHVRTHDGGGLTSRGPCCGSCVMLGRYEEEEEEEVATDVVLALEVGLGARARRVRLH